MPPTMLRLLGEIECVGAGTQEPVRLGQKPKALLALIAAHGHHGVTRERAVALLWGEQDEQSGAAAMRQCLHHLRRSLEGTGVTIAADRDRIALQCTPTDLQQFAELAARDDAAAFAAAARLFRGDFAGDVRADDGEFAQWLALERSSVRGLAHELLERIAGRVGDPDATAAGIGLAHRLLALDPVHEGCCRALMRMLEHGGLRAEALRVYEACRRALRTEIDVEPSTETAALAARIRSTDPSGHQGLAARIPGTFAHLPGSGGVPRAARTGVHPSAMDRFLRAWQLFSQFTAQTNLQARIELEAAVAIDPFHGESLVLLGWTHFFDYIASWTDDPEESCRRAGVQAERALALGGDRGFPRHLLAKLALWNQRYDEALEHARIAVGTAPAYAHSQFHLADVLVHCGRHDEGLRHIRRAMELDPVEYGMFRTIEALALFLTGDLQGALASAESALVRNPNYAWSHWLVAATQARMGNYEAGRAAARRAHEVNPRLQARFGGAPTPLRMARDRALFVDAIARISEALPPRPGRAAPARHRSGAA